MDMRAGSRDSIDGRIGRERLVELLLAAEAHLSRPATVCLVGEASLVLEEWREWTDRVVWAAEPVDGPALEPAFAAAAAERGVEVLREHPGDVVPLPAGFAEGARPASEWRPPGSRAASAGPWLRVLHFDPCSVALRLIARGDEPDYHVVLALLEHGLLSLDDVDRELAVLLPRFSSRTIQQDPAEFRRKYKGLRQMWRARSAGSRPAAP
jgi:hypothetical protein